jgi:SLT domain-containing protein
MMGVMGAAQVAKIQSEQYQPRMTGGNVFAGQAYEVGERGKEMFVPNQNGRIYPNTDNKMEGTQVVRQENKEVSVNFNITSADTRDFDRLIAERMPMIVNGVRRGLA